MQRALSDGAGVHALECRKIVILSRFVALSVSLIQKVSLFQTVRVPFRPAFCARAAGLTRGWAVMKHYPGNTNNSWTRQFFG